MSQIKRKILKKLLNLLQERHDMACTIVGTKKLHHFQPMSTSTLKFRHTQIKKVCNSEQILKEHINGYVSHCLRCPKPSQLYPGYILSHGSTVAYDKAWWLGYVIDKNTEERTVKVNFLTPRGLCSSFKYPERPDILNVPHSDILSTVSASTTTGRTYTIEDAEQKAATDALQTQM